MAAPRAHRQDVLDTATALRLRAAQRIFRGDLAAGGREVLRLARAHRATPMAARTHAVQALRMRPLGQPAPEVCMCVGALLQQRQAMRARVRDSCRRER